MSEALFVGKNTIFLENIDSTQTFANELIAKTSPIEGTCIRTDYQSAGRGQIGRYWHSEAGHNLLCSIILYPKFLQIEHSFYLNIISSLALVDLCNEFNIEAKIKWPNDIYVGDKKLAGILVQNTLQGSSIKSTIIGVGLNVNEVDFPESLPNPISIKTLLHSDLELKQIYTILSNKLEQVYLELKSENYSKLWEQYHHRLYKKNEISLFKRKDETIFSGQIKGISKNGLLIIEAEGLPEYFDFREVQFVFN